MILHQAVDSVSGGIYSWQAATYDAGAGYPGPNSPTNIVVVADTTPAGSAPTVSVLLDLTPHEQVIASPGSDPVWFVLGSFTTAVTRSAQISVTAYNEATYGTLTVQIVGAGGVVSGSVVTFFAGGGSGLLTYTSSPFTVAAGTYSVITTLIDSAAEFASIETVSVG